MADRANETTQTYMDIERSSTRRDGKTHFRRTVDENIKKVYRKMTLEKWRRIVLFACVVALAIDPLFLLIPVIDSEEFCIAYDKTLGIVVSVLRCVCDAFYVIHVFVVITNEVKPLRLQGSLKRKAVRHIFYLLVDISSVLPIPQMVILHLIQTDELVSKKKLKWTILGQYLPRFLRTYPIFREVTKVSANVAESKWIAATINIFLYMLCSYGFGAFWYVIAVEKQIKCWLDSCQKQNETVWGLRRTSLVYENGTVEHLCTSFMFCSPESRGNNFFLRNTCPLINPSEITKNSTDFNFGMFTDALKSGVLERKNKDFTRKFIYCFRWGIRNISALGQNLETSSSAGENFFAIIICVSGLLLFAVLIGNVQKYLQTSTTRVDEREENKRDTEKWMSKWNLKKELRDDIRKHGDYKWRETRGMDEENLLKSIPKHLIKDIRRQIYGKLIAKLKLVPQFMNMDERSLERSLEDLCSRLKTSYYTKGSYIVKEGEPMKDMLYIVSGELESTTTYGTKTGLVADDLCGGELFDWAFDPQSSHYPISSRTIQAITEVEGFLLSANDLKFVATQSRLENRKDMSP